MITQVFHPSPTGVIVLVFAFPITAAALDAAALGLRWIDALAGAVAAAASTFVVLFIWLLIGLAHANLGRRALPPRISPPGPVGAGARAATLA